MVVKEGFIFSRTTAEPTRVSGLIGGILEVLSQPARAGSMKHEVLAGGVGKALGAAIVNRSSRGWLVG